VTAATELDRPPKSLDEALEIGAASRREDSHFAETSAGTVIEDDGGADSALIVFRGRPNPFRDALLWEFQGPVIVPEWLVQRAAARRHDHRAEPGPPGVSSAIEVQLDRLGARIRISSWKEAQHEAQLTALIPIDPS
jgi:hypothetical protein